ncbi:hypothetical protein D3C86_1694750 [compost metagenome]
MRLRFSASDFKGGAVRGARVVEARKSDCRLTLTNRASETAWLTVHFKIMKRDLMGSGADVSALEEYCLSTKEAAKLIGYSHRTLENLRAFDKGPPWIKLTSGKIRYSKPGLEEWALRSCDEPKGAYTWEALRAAELKEKRKQRDRLRKAAAKAGLQAENVHA